MWVAIKFKPIPEKIIVVSVLADALLNGFIISVLTIDTK